MAVKWGSGCLCQSCSHQGDQANCDDIVIPWTKSLYIYILFLELVLVHFVVWIFFPLLPYVKMVVVSLSHHVLRNKNGLKWNTFVNRCPVPFWNPVLCKFGTFIVRMHHYIKCKTPTDGLISGTTLLTMFLRVLTLIYMIIVSFWYVYYWTGVICTSNI